MFISRRVAGEIDPLDQVALGVVLPLRGLLLAGGDRHDIVLAPRDRALLWLAHVEGYDHREIARVLGLQESSVRVILFRARKKLEKELA